MKAEEMRKNPPTGYRIYKYTFPNGKIYIGQTKNHLKLRYYSGYRKNKALSTAFEQYQWEDVKKEILAENLDKQSADREEIRYIELFDSCNSGIGYNVSKGGNLGFKGINHSKETKGKMRKSAIGKHEGKNNWNFGRIRDEKERDKFRKASGKSMRSVVQKSFDGEVIAEFESVSAAARAMNTSPKNIRACIKGISNHACGFLWEYKCGDSD